MLRSNSKCLGNPCSQSWRRKGKAAVGRICRKGRFEAWNERVAVFKLRLKTFLFSQAFSSFSAH